MSARLSKEQKETITNLTEAGFDIKYIMGETGLTRKQVYMQQYWMKKNKTEKKAKKKSKKKASKKVAKKKKAKVISQEQDVIESSDDAADESEIDWRAWCVHYKGLYLEMHALLIENNIDPTKPSLIKDEE
jgi:hypothetical protein